jgi:aminoglycoside phosphotransferase family enzyme/predicted kinase
MDLERLKSDLMEPGVELRETHISLVFLAGPRVFKIKKPVNLGFLDFTQLEARKNYCEREVELNRRLAGDVYRGVVPIARDAAGRLRPGAAGPAEEWAVEMERLPDERCADRRLQEGRFGRAEVERLAERIAAFHEAARCDAETTAAGSLAVVERNVRESFEQARSEASRFLSARELAEVERFQLELLRVHRARFQERERAGRIRDGHGDLRLEHCYLDDHGGIAIIDCIEFNDRFRYGDVCSDIAFLAMDLAWHDRHDLSEALLAAYARAANDYDLYGVVDFYESYRAFVRGKVNLMLEADEGASQVVRERAAAQARKYFMLAHACAKEPSHVPRLYAVGGMIASGKSTVARELAALIHGPALEADRTRKHLAGVEPTTPLHDAPFSGHYSREDTERVYNELLRRAAIVLGSKRSVVIDASFRERAQRAKARELALRLGVPFTFIECSADLETSRARLLERARHASISDGRIELLADFAARFEPVDELLATEHTRLDTRRPLDEALAVLSRRLR